MGLNSSFGQPAGSHRSIALAPAGQRPTLPGQPGGVLAAVVVHLAVHQPSPMDCLVLAGLAP
jgi:hypothetical protein